MITAAKAVINSVIQKLCHTPWAPITLLRIHARRSIMPIYLNMEIISEFIPFPRASSAPDMVTGIEETINPMLIILIARPRLLLCPDWMKKFLSACPVQ